MRKPVLLLSGWLSMCACGADVDAPAPSPAPAAVVVEAPPPAPEPVPALPARPSFQVVVRAPVDAATARAAMDAWNRALGWDALVPAPDTTADGIADHVYLYTTTDLARGQGANTALDDTWVYTMRIRPDLAASERVIAHEFGHVLGGWGHSDVDGDLMFWRDVTPKAPVVISAADVAQVRLWLNVP